MTGRRRLPSLAVAPIALYISQGWCLAPNRPPYDRTHRTPLAFRKRCGVPRACARRTQTAPLDPRCRMWTTTAEVDYSAADEYVRAHYGFRRRVKDPADVGSSGGDGVYFESSGRALESVCDARGGVVARGALGLGRDRDREPPSLDRCGFELVSDPISAASGEAAVGWTNAGRVGSLWLPTLRDHITSALGVGDGNDEGAGKITHVVFWHPMVRGTECEMSDVGGGEGSRSTIPTAPVAGLVHIDTDIGAHDPEGIIRLVERNHVAAGGETTEPFPREELIEAIRSGRRFAVINAWKNIDPLGQTVRHAPMALLLPHYREEEGGCKFEKDGETGMSQKRPCFPDATPDPKLSQWYTFPNISVDECLLFKQYDRILDRTSDLWHCALSSIVEDGAPPRLSFDIRALVIFEDTVPPIADRYGPDRLRPLISLEESGCFCDVQAQARQGTLDGVSGKVP